MCSYSHSSYIRLSGSFGVCKYVFSDEFYEIEKKSWCRKKSYKLRTALRKKFRFYFFFFSRCQLDLYFACFVIFAFQSVEKRESSAPFMWAANFWSRSRHQRASLVFAKAISFLICSNKKMLVKSHERYTSAQSFEANARWIYIYWIFTFILHHPKERISRIWEEVYFETWAVMCD